MNTNTGSQNIATPAAASSCACMHVNFNMHILDQIPLYSVPHISHAQSMYYTDNKYTYVQIKATLNNMHILCVAICM